MTLSAIAAVLLELATLERRALHGTTGRVPGVWMLVSATLMFASAVVSTRRRGWAWLWACNAAVYWWLFLN
ncbi:hypothetical protein AMOR_28140 [Anaeromyxobacter oryzae]|uniref:Uncharacterized protein n=2 Tax=Anaeromyxobacter oryzae TaxID=2918170 RepID=A0ABN6MS68_9BACT|nr:hypothetical protein AMOR_28140 [Anaeromyxobacter oryzae]